MSVHANFLDLTSLQILGEEHKLYKIVGVRSPSLQTYHLAL